MKTKIKLIALVGCVVMICAALAGCGTTMSKEQLVGTWYLQHSEATVDGQPTYTEDDLKVYRDANLDIYMNLKDDETLTYMNLGVSTDGTWSFENNKLTVMLSGTSEMTGEYKNNQLVLEYEGGAFYFDKGETIEEQTVADEGEISMADENGLSIVMESGEKLDKEVTVADDDVVSLVIDGKGVAPMGDPGYNLQIENKTDKTISVWLPDPFHVGEKEVLAYMYTIVDPGKSTTSFLQFDTDQIESKSTDALVDVTGKIQVDDAEGNNLGTYDVEM